MNAKFEVQQWVYFDVHAWPDGSNTNGWVSISLNPFESAHYARMWIERNIGEHVRHEYRIVQVEIVE